MATFERRRVTLAPGAERAYVAADWAGALVLVERGELELEGVSGARRRFVGGDLLWLAGLRVRAVRNAGAATTVLVCIRRRPMSSRPTRGLSRRPPRPPGDITPHDR